MVTEAVRRITTPAISAFIRMRRVIRAAEIVAGIITIAAALKRELAGRTINSESRQALNRLLRKHR